MARRVAVTGLGVVSPLGVGWRALWDGLCAARVATGPVSSFDASRYGVDRGAEVRGFAPEEHLAVLAPSEVGRATQMAAAAARLALADAGAPSPGPRPERDAVVFGTTSGEPLEIERWNDAWVAGDRDALDARFARRYPCAGIPGAVAIEVGFDGPNAMIPTACAAGNYALAHAFDLVRDGRADRALAGGADCFSRITYAGFARLGAIAPDRCRPFDKDRKGMIPGEGAAALLLEPLDEAVRRGAPIYAEVIGYGLSCDAHHMTGAHPQGDGAVRAMERALRMAGIGAGEVSYVSAHGTGTPSNDRVEALALGRVFGARAAVTPVSSVKSMIGHTMGAASAIEAAVVCLAARFDRVPPTANFEAGDADLPLDVVPNRARDLAVEVAMNNAYAFGGNNASVLVRKVRG